MLIFKGVVEVARNVGSCQIFTVLFPLDISYLGFRTHLLKTLRALAIIVMAGTIYTRYSLSLTMH